MARVNDHALIFHFFVSFLGLICAADHYWSTSRYVHRKYLLGDWKWLYLNAFVGFDCRGRECRSPPSYAVFPWANGRHGWIRCTLVSWSNWAVPGPTSVGQSSCPVVTRPNVRSALSRVPRRGSRRCSSGVFGQPVVRAEVAAQVGVSIAHSGDFAIALAFDSGHPMGVDLEMIDIRNESTMRAQLSARETARCDEQSVSQLEMSAHLWSAKEAVGKAMRSGLTVPSCLLEVSSIQLISCGYRLEFAQLIQYAAVAVRMGDYSLAVGLPRRTRLDESDLRGDLLRELASV